MVEWNVEVCGLIAFIFFLEILINAQTRFCILIIYFYLHFKELNQTKILFEIILLSCDSGSQKIKTNSKTYFIKKYAL